jgi:large subunit ribosomal protein L29
MAKATKETNLNTEALESKLSTLKKDGMNMRFQHAAGQFPKTHLLRANRREVARVKTELNKGKK